MGKILKIIILFILKPQKVTSFWILGGEIRLDFSFKWILLTFCTALMNGLDLWEQKVKVLTAIKTLKIMKQSDEYIVDFVAENFQVTPDYVRKLMKEQPDSLPEETKTQASSVPAHS